MQVLLPPGPRLTDQAIVDLNEQEQFNNQIDVYVTGLAASLEFLGLQNGATLWGFDDPAVVADGTRHAIRAQWNPTAASMWVDQMQTPSTQLVRTDAGTAFPLDHVDVGFSLNSSGYLSGLVSSVSIGNE